MSRRDKELIDRSYAETDDQKLKAILSELTRITLDEAFVVPVNEVAGKGSGLEVARANVKNVTWGNTGDFAYQDMAGAL